MVVEAEQEEQGSAAVPALQRRLALAGMTLGLSVAALDQMVLSTAATAISAELGGLAQVPWLFAGYLLGSACTMPLWGRLGDVYGRRPVFQAAVGLFIGASLLAAAAPTMELLVVARALQGLGGGGLLTLPNAIVADLVEPRLRASYYALNTGVWAVTGLLGPMAGGLLVDTVGWRAIFYLYVPLGIAATVLMAVGHRVAHARVPHALDYPGALLLATSVGSLLLLLSATGIGAAWTLPLLAVSLAAGWRFVTHERRVAEPLIPMAVLGIPAVRVSLAVMLLYGLANFAVAVFVPMWAITVAGASATEAGLRLLPMPVGLLLGSLVVGRLIARGFDYRLYPAAGLVIHIAALVLLASQQPDTPVALGLLYCLIAGLGAGGVNPVITYALQHAVPARQIGLVTALPAFFRFIGQALGIAVLGALLTRVLAHELAALVPDPGFDLDPSTLQARAEDILALGPEVGAAVAEACRRALSFVFLVMAGIHTVAMLISLRMPAETADLSEEA